MTPKLTWIDQNGHEHTIEVRDRLYIGRVCHGVEDDKRIMIDDNGVSRDHASISYSHGQLTLRDLSRNGTRLNDKRLTAGVDYSLKQGDQIGVGPLVFTLNWQPEGVAEVVPDDDATRTVALAEMVTHLVADVRGFSTWVQNADPERVYRVMSDVFDILSEQVHLHQGVVKDYAGDAIYAFWEHGAQAQSPQAINAVRAAVAQRTAIEHHLSTLSGAYADAAKLKIGWAVTTGSVMLGHYGVKPDTVAVIGDSANLAFRLAGLANNNMPSPILLCAPTARLVQDEFTVQSLGDVQTKGRSGLEEVFGLR